VPPEAEDSDEHPDPLFDSTRSYLDQIDVFKRHQGRPTEKRVRRDKGKSWSSARRAAADKPGRVKPPRNRGGRERGP
jgi:hypothetical protein